MANDLQQMVGGEKEGRIVENIDFFTLCSVTKEPNPYPSYLNVGPFFQMSSEKSGKFRVTFCRNRSLFSNNLSNYSCTPVRLPPRPPPLLGLSSQAC